MDNIQSFSYQSLFNEDTSVINSLPNSVIISDNFNNITSTRNINNNIDNITINPNKLDFSNTITQDITTANRIFNTNVALTPISENEYITKYYADSLTGIVSGSYAPAVTFLDGTGFSGLSSNYIYQVDPNNVMESSLLLSLTACTTGGTNHLTFTFDNPYTFVSSVNKAISSVISIYAFDGSTYKMNHQAQINYPTPGKIWFDTAFDSGFLGISIFISIQFSYIL